MEKQDRTDLPKKMSWREREMRICRCKHLQKIFFLLARLGLDKVKY
jgi:hypothetical protein